MKRWLSLVLVLGLLLPVLLVSEPVPSVAQAYSQANLSKPDGSAVAVCADPDVEFFYTVTDPPPQFKLASFRPDAQGPPVPVTGYIPPPMDMSHLTGQHMPGNGVLQALPSSYDWRDNNGVTAVKNQGACGSCFAFASVGNLEARMRVEGEGDFDFSENNAKECTYRPTSCGGGNFYDVINLFTQKGTVLEACDPYVPSNVSCNATCPYQKTVLDWRIISGNAVANTEVLKQYIYDYGPVYTAMYAGSSALTMVDSNYVYAPTDAWGDELSAYDGSYTLYYAGSESPNHAVLIVGWDDTLTHAGGSGGWIVKNSWGSSWGDGGYFYIAYGSAQIGTASAFVYEWQDYDSDGTVWYYDDGGLGGYFGNGVTAWGLDKFLADADTSVTRVEFWTTDVTTDVDVYIYDSFDGSTLGTLLASKENLAFSEAGYHSVALDAPIAVDNGDEVVAVARITNQSFDKPIPLDSSSPIETGRTYVSLTGASGSWTEVGQYDFDVAIRLRTGGALASPPTVNSITPNTGANTGSIATSIAGSDFQNGATVKLARTGQPDIHATGVVVVNANQITGNFDLTGAAAGAWNVVVTNPDAQSGTLSNGFTVTFSGKTWTGAISTDWHTSGNWDPTGVPAIGDDVLIPDVARDPIISTDDAAVNNLTINSGAVVDLTDRTLTVEGALVNNGTLKQTRDVTPDSTTEFLRIRNQADNQTKYYGVDFTPQDSAHFSSQGALQLVELTLDSLPARSATPHSVAIYAPDAPVSLVVDDGDHETASGVNNATAGTGKQFIWLNRFTPEAAAYPFTLDEIWVMFDSFGGGANIDVGDAIDLVVYEDSDGDPTNGATWLATIPVTVQAVDGTVWSVYSLSSPILLEGPGDVIIAAINRYVVSGQPPMCYPATVDTTAGQDRSWIGWWLSDPPSPAVLPPDLHFELLTGTSAGNWMVRGYGSTVTANTPPTISGLPDQLLLVNDVANNAIDLWAYASDNESPDDELAFTIDNTPDPGAGVSIDSNRYIDIFPETDWEGQTDVVVHVEDPEGLFDTDSFQVTVTSTTNTPPTISGLPDQWLLVNEVANNAIDLWAYASDNESPDDELAFTIDNTPDPSAGVHIDSNRYIDIFPDTDWTGQTDVVVRVEDPEGLFDTDSFQVTVTSTTNTPPTISGLPDITVPMNTTSVLPWLDLWDYADDGEDSDDQLTFTIANTPDPNAGVSIDSNRYILVIPATDWVGVTDVEIQVQDTGGLTDTDIFQVTITGTVNTPPAISGLPDQTLPVDDIVNNAIDLWAYASDNESPDDALTFTIDNTPDPGAGVRIDSNRYVDIFPDTGWEGQTDVVVRVEDPEGLSDTDSFRVTIGSGVSATSVTVAVSGNQFCANRATGVERCFDIDPATPISATVRFYFSEAERNGQILDDLLVFHYDGDWIEEPGPYTRSGTGDAQYVEAQNVDDFSPFVLDSGLPPQPDHYLIYLPLVLKRWPPIPDTPVLNAISNDDGDGDYAVTWNTAYLAEAYTLQEATDPAFSSPTTRYTGSGTSWNASSKSAGTYYYRVRASRSWNGQTLYSAWSNIRSVVVQPPVGAPAGFWEGQGVEFYVTPDKAHVDDFAIYISVSGCGNYKIQRSSPVSLNNNQFSFSGSFYASGTLHSNTTASGNAGLDKYYIYGCGYVTGSFSWTANWVNDSQPSLVFAEVVELEKTDSVADGAFVVLPSE
jgi:C1A family cysteine protease